MSTTKLDVRKLFFGIKNVNHQQFGLVQPNVHGYSSNRLLSSWRNTPLWSLARRSVIFPVAGWEDSLSWTQENLC